MLKIASHLAEHTENTEDVDNKFIHTRLTIYNLNFLILKKKKGEVSE